MPADTEDRNYLPYHIFHSGQLTMRVACFDDGLDPQHEGYLHDLAKAASDCYDGVVEVHDMRLLPEYRVLATFGEDPDHAG